MTITFTTTVVIGVPTRLDMTAKSLNSLKLQNYPHLSKNSIDYGSSQLEWDTLKIIYLQGISTYQLKIPQ